MNEIADGVIGGGIYGLLVVFAVQLFRRTRDTDARRDALTQAAADHDHQASAQRDVLVEELRALRGEVTALADKLNRAADERPS